MSNKLKLIAIISAAALLVLVLYLSRQAHGWFEHPEPAETAAAETTEPETTGFSGDELPMLPFN